MYCWLGLGVFSWKNTLNYSALCSSRQNGKDCSLGNMLCSNECGSVLRYHDVNAIKLFSWDALYTEFANNSPVLLSLLETCSQTETERVNRRAVTWMCVALLFWSRTGNADNVVCIAIMFRGCKSWIYVYAVVLQYN